MITEKTNLIETNLPFNLSLGIIEEYYYIFWNSVNNCTKFTKKAYILGVVGFKYDIH